MVKTPHSNAATRLLAGLMFRVLGFSASIARSDCSLSNRVDANNINHYFHTHTQLIRDQVTQFNWK